MLEKIGGVHNRDHGVEAGDVLKSGPALVGEGEGLRDRERLGNAGGLDQEVVEAPFLREAAHLFQQIITQRAADAAIAHFNEFFLRAAQLRPALANKLGINIHLAHVIHDHRHAQSLTVVEHMIEQRCLSRSQKARKHCHGELFRC